MEGLVAPPATGCRVLLFGDQTEDPDALEVVGQRCGATPGQMMDVDRHAGTPS